MKRTATMFFILNILFLFSGLNTFSQENQIESYIGTWKIISTQGNLFKTKNKPLYVILKENSRYSIIHFQKDGEVFKKKENKGSFKVDYQKNEVTINSMIFSYNLTNLNQIKLQSLSNNEIQINLKKVKSYTPYIDLFKLNSNDYPDNYLKTDQIKKTLLGIWKTHIFNIMFKKNGKNMNKKDLTQFQIFEKNNRAMMITKNKKIKRQRLKYYIKGDLVILFEPGKENFTMVFRVYQNDENQIILKGSVWVIFFEFILNRSNQAQLKKVMGDINSEVADNEKLSYIKTYGQFKNIFHGKWKWKKVEFYLKKGQAPITLDEDRLKTHYIFNKKDEFIKSVHIKKEKKTKRYWNIENFEDGYLYIKTKKQKHTQRIRIFIETKTSLKMIAKMGNNRVVIYLEKESDLIDNTKNE